MGVEEPERYVVGSDANSINPATGAPEFFFKKIKKGVKKKAVVKVVKKVAPIILPIALSFTPLGPIYGAALGSGIGTLIQGGSIKDALKSALISGATGAVFSGFTGGGSFMENIQTSLADPIGRFGQTISGAQTSLSNVFGGRQHGPRTLVSRPSSATTLLPQLKAPRLSRRRVKQSWQATPARFAQKQSARHLRSRPVQLKRSALRTPQLLA
jgi:hypothetical protein